ncbi:MAG: hypothetical protein MUF54_14505 [Polyangiaceae bacterium]|jgi:hypothetical protein|nr:hypothetical protein [Polyangiaceae bacterium]
MVPVFRSTPVVVCALVAFAAMVAMGFFPPFAGPRYESALAAGLVLPALVAVATALMTSASRCAPSAAFAHGLEAAFLILSAALLAVVLHGFREGFCDLGTGLLLYALGPGMGVLLGAAWGVAVGELAGRAHSGRWRTAIALVAAIIGPILTVLLSVWRFYTSPMVYAYDPFFGFFSGTLYDTIVTDCLSSYLLYRAGTFATLLAFGAGAAVLERGACGRLTFSTTRHPGVVWLAVAAAVASLIASAEGPRLGHWQTDQSIAHELGGRIENERCEVIYPRSLRDDDARLLLRDCSTQARQVSAYLVIEDPPRIRVFAFANRDQKRQLMGASQTSIAKPWRREVYITVGGYPHPVLGHELAHALAGSFARGPFDVAGDWGGWRPDPGLIEGLAEAASPDDDELTPMQWSKAMLKIGVLPALDDVFALRFMGHNASLAYTVAGAFVGWVRDTFGMGVVQRWYGGKSLEQLTGAPLPVHEARWKEQLARLELPASALDYARAQFERPGVFRRRCPHAVDAMNRDAGRLAAEGDCTEASRLYERASALDPLDERARMGLASCAARLEGRDAAKTRWMQLAGDGLVAVTARHRAQESLADLLLLEGEGQKARAIYQELQKTLLGEDRLRTLDVKIRASANPVEARAIGELLIVDAVRRSSPKLAHALLGRWMAEVPSDGLPAYLIGRNLVEEGAWKVAAEYLDWALERSLPEPRVLSEALRLRLIAACALRDDLSARRAHARWATQPGVPKIRREVLERRLGSCVPTASTAKADQP